MKLVESSKIIIKDFEMDIQSSKGSERFRWTFEVNQINNLRKTRGDKDENAQHDLSKNKYGSNKIVVSKAYMIDPW